MLDRLDAQLQYTEDNTRLLCPEFRYQDSGSTRVQVSRAEHFQEERSAADGSEASQYLGFLRRELLVGEDTRRMEFPKLFKLVDEVRRLLR